MTKGTKDDAMPDSWLAGQHGWSGMRDQLWQGGTNYGAMDGPAGPTKAPQVVLRQPNRSGGIDFVGDHCGMTDHSPAFTSQGTDYALIHFYN